MTLICACLYVWMYMSEFCSDNPLCDICVTYRWQCVCLYHLYQHFAGP